MLRRLALFVCAVVAVSGVSSLHAQSCSSYPPYYYSPSFECDMANTGGPCAPDAPIKFKVQPPQPSLASCPTTTWSFGSAAPSAVTTGDQTLAVTLPAGTHSATASVSLPGWGAYTSSLQVAVGRGYVQLHGDSASANEGTTISLLVVRTNVTHPTTVAWEATGPGAAALSQTSGTVTLGAGEVSRPINIPTVDDTVSTGDRSVIITLQSATGGYLLRPFQATVHTTVLENDFAVVQFTQPSWTFRENVGVASITVQRTGILNTTVQTSYTTFNGCCPSIIVGGVGTLVFQPGETLKSISVPVLNDDAWRGQRSTNAVLLGLSSNARPGANNFVTLTVEEDEPAPAVSVEDIQIKEGNSGAVTATFTVRLTSPISDGGLSYSLVPVSARAGSDFAPSGAFLSFSGGVTSRTVSAVIFGDTTPEPDEVLALRLTRDPSMPIVLPTRDATLTILNDDMSVTPSGVRVRAGETTTALIDVGSAVTSPLAIPISNSDPAVVEVPESITIAAGTAKAFVEIRGLATGQATLGVQMPGGITMSVHASVFQGAALVFSPQRATAFAGKEVAVQVSLDPPSAFVERIGLTSGDKSIATVPEFADIPPGGAASIVIQALRTGTTTIITALPASYGGDRTSLLVDVHEAPETPTLGNVVPSSGPSAGGTAFEASGAHLATDCTLFFGGVPATEVALTDTGSLTGTTPPHTAGTVDVVLQCGTAQFTLANAFTYQAVKPTISSVAPTFGSTAGGTHVRAAVTNVQSGCWLFFDGAPATSVRTNGTTAMTGVTPPRTRPGSVAVSVRCGDESASRAAAFTYTTASEPAASIISIDPLIGAPGESVTLTGSRFRNDDRIHFDDTAAALLRTAPDTHVVRIPELPVGTSSITLTDVAGRTTTSGPIFTILEARPPAIDRVSPKDVAAGAELVLEGSAFRPGYTFSVAGKSARIVSLALDRVVVRLDANTAAGDHRIDVLNASGKTAAIGPAVSVRDRGVVVKAVTPGCATTEAAVRVTITGSGFVSGAKVLFNGVAATSVEFITASELKATAPASATGLATITVVNPNGDRDSISDAFRYNSQFDPNARCESGRSRSVRH